ncbi:hypothetical protein LCGC14_2316780 [marine sediment metagenome]|uniref:Uncharacterized protein n=1 Tax=marine sediment metagenome TaxID=412755 RepID=A0A0F9CJ65_9ZZZZ
MRSCYIEVKVDDGEDIAFLWNKRAIGEGLPTFLFPDCLYKQVRELGFYELTAYNKHVTGANTFEVIAVDCISFSGEYVCTGAGICAAFLDTLLGPGWKFDGNKPRTVYFKIKKIGKPGVESTKSSHPRSDHGR